MNTNKGEAVNSGRGLTSHIPERIIEKKPKKKNNPTFKPNTVNWQVERSQQRGMY